MSKGPVSVFDVARFILRRLGPVSAMKLHKLLYYCQAWSLVWTDRTLFKARIEAWVSGPVIPEVFRVHRGEYLVNALHLQKGDARTLSGDQRETVRRVLEYYGDKDSQWLSDLTHMEEPWRRAREGFADSERGNQEISLASMIEYYSTIPDLNN